MNALLALLTHRGFLVRAATGLLVGILICFSAWAASLAWLPEGFLLKLPLPTIGTCEANVANSVRIFVWNLILTGGLVLFSSLFALGRLPCGYLVPWLTFAAYGGMLGTNSFLCEQLSDPVPLSMSVLWTRAGFREIAAYLLIAAALANQFLWRQSSFFSHRVERVRTLRELKIDFGAILGLFAAALLLGWAAVVEVMP